MEKKRATPFVIGVLANLCGDPIEPAPRLRDRSFVRVREETLSKLFHHKQPSLKFELSDIATSKESRVAQLSFNTREDLWTCMLSGDVASSTEISLAETQLLNRRFREDERIHKLVASWTGLEFLIHAVEDCPNVVIKVLDVNKTDLRKDLERAVEFDQSALFKKVYDEGLASFGGDLFGCLIADYDFTNDREDISLIGQLSHIAAVVGSPLLISASPSFLGLEVWSELNPRFCSEWTMSSTFYSHWESFRASEDADFVYLLAPEVRVPPSSPPVSCASVNSAVGDYSDKQEFVWINPAYVVATAIGRAFEINDLEHIRSALFKQSGDNLHELIPPLSADSGEESVNADRSAFHAAQLELRNLGLNLLAAALARDLSPLSKLTSACSIGVHTHESGLPRTLYLMHAAQRLRQHLMEKRGFWKGEQVLHEVKNWIERYVPLKIGDCPDLRSETQFSSTHTSTSIRIELQHHEPKIAFSVCPSYWNFKFPVPPKNQVHQPQCCISLLTDLPFVDRSWHERSAFKVDKDNLDAVIKDVFRLPIRGLETFEFSTVADFDPEALIRLSKSLSLLYEERKQLIGLTAFALVHATRRTTVNELVCKPGGAAGLAYRVEAWDNIRSAPAEAPVRIDEICTDVNGWDCFEQLLPLKDSLLACARWAQKRPNIGAPGGAPATLTLIENIDRLLSDSLRTVLRNPQFRDAEARWRAIRWLIDSVDNSQSSVTLFASNPSAGPGPSRRFYLASGVEESVGKRAAMFTLLAKPFNRIAADQLIVVLEHDLSKRPRGALTIKQLLQQSEPSRKPIIVCPFGDAQSSRQSTDALTKSIRILIDSPEGENVVLVATNFLVRHKYEHCGFHPPAFGLLGFEGETFDDDLTTSAVYPVALTLTEVIKLQQPGRVSFDNFRSALGRRGLMCRRLGRAILVTRTQ